MATKKSVKAATLTTGILNPEDYNTNAFVHECDLIPLIKKINSGGGGSGGTTDYTDLINKPSIESTTLQGNLSASDLGLATANGLAAVDTQVTSLTGRVTSAEQSIGQNTHDITTLSNGLAGKQDSLTAGDNIIITNNVISAITQQNIMIGAYDIYDTTERVIGYYDGKPLYRKMINVPALPNNTSLIIQTGITNIDKILLLRGLALSGSVPDETWQAPLPYVDPRSSDSNILLDYIANGGKVRILTKIDMSDKSGFIILEYTKTTDTASTIAYGHENQLQPTVQIVGTFNDGSTIKPIYQQSWFNIPITATADSHRLRTQTFGNIGVNKKVISMQGTTMDNGGTVASIPYIDAYIGIHSNILYISNSGDLNYLDYTTSNTTLSATIRWTD